MILQAFDAAADQKQFPEQLKQVTVWQAQRLIVRSRTAPTTEGPPQQFTIDPNEVDPIRGTTYAQQALAGLQKHATQGPWPKSISPTGGRLIRYNLVRQVQSAPALPPDAKSPIAGLVLPESIRTGFVAPTIDNKPLTEFLDKRGEVLVSLINARKRGAFTAAKEVVDLDPQRFKLMSARLDKALATAAGVAVNVESDEPVLVPSAKTKISASLANTGDSDVQIKRVVLHSFDLDNRIPTADKMLPETETSGHIEVPTPKTASLTVPAADHLYDGQLFGQPLRVDADLNVDGANFKVSNEIRRDVAPPVEILKVDPDIYVRTPATSQRPLEFKVRLINHMPSEFRGLVRIVGQSLETGREVSLASHVRRSKCFGSQSAAHQTNTSKVGDRSHS